jgi:hypothetical protein
VVAGQDVQVVKIGLGAPGQINMLEPGQQLAINSMPVVLASDQPVNVVIPAGMATEASLLKVSLETTQQLVLTALNAIQGFVDGLEAGQTAGNSTLTSIAGFVDGLEGLESAGNATLTAIQGFVDGLEAGQAAANLLLTDIKTNTGAAGAAPTTTATVTSVAAAVASTQILAANAARRGASLYNDSTAELKLKLGTGASATSFSVDMLPGSYFEVPFGYTGVLHGIWTAVNGSARVTELTP